MKLQIKSLNLRISEKFERERRWHRWFVWYPLRANPKTVIFLEKVYRRRDYYGKWEYSLTDPEKVG